MSGNRKNGYRMENVPNYSSDEGLGTMLFLVPTSDCWQEAKVMEEGNIWRDSADEGKYLAFLPTSDVGKIDAGGDYMGRFFGRRKIFGLFAHL